MNLKQIQLSCFSPATILGAVIAFMAIVTLSNALFTNAQLDFTEEKLFTLSDGTEQILEDLKDPITMRFFFSRKLSGESPILQNYATQVQELLERYATVAGSNLTLEIIDPESFSQEEDMAIGYGVQGIPVTAAGNKLYFGLAISDKNGKTHTIPFFDMNRERFLEYDITRTLYELTHPEKTTIGLLSTLPLSETDGGNIMIEQVKELFKIVPLDKDVQAIPENIGVLMLVHPQGLNEATLYAIDQFVLGGGKLLLFTDPYAETAMTEEKNSVTGLEKLFAAWGFSIAADKVIGDRVAAHKVRGGEAGSQLISLDYLPWLNLRNRNFNSSDLIASELKTIKMATAGNIEKTAEGKTEVLPLISSSTQAMRMDTALLANPEPAELLHNFKTENKSFILAARVSGSAKTAFPEGVTISESTESGTKTIRQKKSTHLAASREPINLIVIADTDMLKNQFWVQVQQFFSQVVTTPTADNGAFIVNALDNLSGSGDLISLRSRGTSSRPFEKVIEIQREAEQQYLAKERELQRKLQETETRLAALQQAQGGQEFSPQSLSAEQQEEIKRFRDEAIMVRKELRSVQHELNKDIAQLAGTVKFINILLIPLLVIGTACGLFFYISRSRKQRANRILTSVQ